MSSPLPTTPSPSQSSAKTTEFRVTRVKLGNGYEQRSIDGLNATRDSWTLVYENISLSNLQTMTTFFDGLGGATYFTWTAFGDASSSNWITNGNYTIQVTSGTTYTLSVPITQVFDL
jgi:phage-related protein